jgi:hypothetical protein
VLKEDAAVPAGLQALQALGTVTASDYEQVFVPLVDRMRRTSSRMRLLYEFGPGFERITLGALWADARLGTDYLQLLDGFALVSDIDWIRTTTRQIGVFMPCPVRLYGSENRADAVAWLTSLAERPPVSVAGVVKAYVGGLAAALASLGSLAIRKASDNAT